MISSLNPNKPLLQLHVCVRALPPTPSIVAVAVAHRSIDRSVPSIIQLFFLVMHVGVGVVLDLFFCLGSQGPCNATINHQSGSRVLR